MEDIQELYSKKFQTVQEKYERIVEKLSADYSKRHENIISTRDAALAGIPYRLHETNPEAYNNAINSIYQAYGEKINAWQKDWERDLGRITTIHDHNKKQLLDAYNRSYQEHHRINTELNNQSSEKLKNLTVTLLNSINPITPRITTISSAR